MTTLESELAGIVGPEHVEVLGERDVRVTPGSAAEVAEVIRRAGTQHAAIYPIGAGGRGPRTDGARAGVVAPAARAPEVPEPSEPGRRPRVHVTTRRLDHVLQLDETSLLVHAQAGLTGLELERILAPRGLSIGDYPPGVLSPSLGGIIAVRTPGKSSARHGFFEEAVVGVSAVLADGRTVHTRVAPRRATGPDLARALCGSEGTIGFITSVVLRIHLKPQTRLTAAYVLPSIDAAVSAVYLALREEAAPSGLRIYDAPEAKAHFGTTITAGEALLVAATAGLTDLAACDRDLIASAVIAEGGAPTDAAVADTWWRRLHAGEPTPGPTPTLQVMATPSKVRAVYHAVVAAIRTSGANARAHISRFDADGAVLFLTLDRSGDAVDDGLVTVAERAAESAGAWLLGARAQKLDVYLRALRATLDPHGIMNPGALA